MLCYTERVLTCNIDLSEYINSIVRCILAMLSCKSEVTKEEMSYSKIITENYLKLNFYK